MSYIQSMDRKQIMMCTMDSFVDQESIARVIDVFVESLDLDELGFDRVGATLKKTVRLIRQRAF